MPYVPVQRSTLLIDHMGGNHLHVVLHDPDRQGLCLLAPISSDKEDRFHDPACAFEGGEHAFIDHPSHVVYRKLLQVRAEHISRMVAAGVYQPKEPLEPAVFDRVAAGLFISDEARPRMVTDARRAGLVG